MAGVGRKHLIDRPCDAYVRPLLSPPGGSTNVFLIPFFLVLFFVFVFVFLIMICMCFL